LNRIANCVSKGLDVFGKNVGLVVYHKLLKDCGMVPDDIVAKPDEFIECVQRMFGPAGAKVIETQLVRAIREDFGLSAEKSFVDVVRKARAVTNGNDKDCEILY